MDVNALSTQINSRYSEWIMTTKVAFAELTIEVKPENLLDLCRQLRDDADLDFKLLVDVCGVDYLHYGLVDWETESTTATGFGRGVTSQLLQENPTPRDRFAVVYHLLSLKHNHRVRLRVNIPNEAEPIVDSVISLWPAANWFEREVFDLFGILFRSHPDLRRLLTDYGFVGYPFRKDFPLIGKVEARYDAALKRVIYEPVSIQARTLEPKVIRHDSRYEKSDER
ncbi:MAG: NADH-quinone oxidoreductase subunit C [Gammaproteobacteria bacterium RIFCSPHIGHO2_12_FULL_37_14]|nr:MAG: NADH-quinone oxidoreductase subunit C [Gammaproteobacteria bacterium RIFCSPHIGHO2_12_FULL_37_14]